MVLNSNLPIYTCSTADWMSENTKIPNSEWTSKQLLLRVLKKEYETDLKTVKTYSIVDGLLLSSSETCVLCMSTFYSVNERAPFPRVNASLVSSLRDNHQWHLRHIFVFRDSLLSTFLWRRPQKAVKNPIFNVFKTSFKLLFGTLIMGTDCSHSFSS